MIKPFQEKNKDGTLRHGGRWVIKDRVPTDPPGRYRREVCGYSPEEAADKLAEIRIDIKA